tara:strand:+ start:72 stop:299 length:228 start_codon:yes stop_codon:yes gene_type:complete
MENFSKRRVDVATCWASNRISVLDTLQHYEESYAVAQEFREWIVNIGEDDTELAQHVMNLPKDLNNILEKKINDL